MLRLRRLSRPQKWIVGLGLLMLVLGLANLGRVLLAFRLGALLPGLPMRVSWSYLAVRGGVWGIAFIACAVGLVSFRYWGRWSTLAVSTLYQVHSWVDHLLLDASDYADQARPRDLALTLLFLALVWGVLNWPNVRRVFRPNRRSAP